MTASSKSLTVILTVACLVAFSFVGLSRATSSQEDDGAAAGTSENWPLRATYVVNGLTEPTLDAAQARSERVFEGASWSSWRDTSTGDDGSCKMRFADQLILSFDDCETAAFDDNYDLEIGEPYGAGPFVRPQGGIADSILDQSLPGTESALAQSVAEDLGIDAANMAVVKVKNVVPCHAVGVDCDREGMEELTQIVHEPTGLMVYELSLFDSQMVYEYRVEDLRFGVADLPGPLNND